MSQENVDRLLEGYEAWNRDEIERIPEFAHPDLLARPSGVFPGMEPVYRGHEGLVQFWRTLREPWESFHVQPLRTAHDANRVVAEVRFTGRGAGSGAETTLDFAHLWRFREGLLVEFVGYPSWQEALEAAGLRE